MGVSSHHNQKLEDTRQLDKGYAYAYSVSVVSEQYFRIGETTNWAFPQQDSVVYIDQVESARYVRMFTRVRHRVPFYCTSLDKATLSVFPAQQHEACLAAVALQRFTANPITDHHQLTAGVRKSGLFGYDVDDEARGPDIRYIAVISISAPSSGSVRTASVIWGSRYAMRPGAVTCNAVSVPCRRYHSRATARRKDSTTYGGNPP